jgi:K+-transporting ATPase KdpF subunit
MFTMVCIAGVLVTLLLAYLGYAMLFPEKF